MSFKGSIVTPQKKNGPESFIITKIKRLLYTISIPLLNTSEEKRKKNVRGFYETYWPLIYLTCMYLVFHKPYLIYLPPSSVFTYSTKSWFYPDKNLFLTLCTDLHGHFIFQHPICPPFAPIAPCVFYCHCSLVRCYLGISAICFVWLYLICRVVMNHETHRVTGCNELLDIIWHTTM